MIKRNLFVMLLLIDCLEIFYLFYWISSVQDELKFDSQNNIKLDGAATVILIIVTLGIYYFIWQWKTCKILSTYGTKNQSVLTLILSILIIGMIINPLIIQSSLNSIQDNYNLDGNQLLK